MGSIPAISWYFFKNMFYFIFLFRLCFTPNSLTQYAVHCPNVLMFELGLHAILICGFWCNENWDFCLYFVEYGINEWVVIGSFTIDHFKVGWYLIQKWFLSKDAYRIVTDKIYLNFMKIGFYGSNRFLRFKSVFIFFVEFCQRNCQFVKNIGF